MDTLKVTIHADVLLDMIEGRLGQVLASPSSRGARRSEVEAASAGKVESTGDLREWLKGRKPTKLEISGTYQADGEQWVHLEIACEGAE